MNNWLLSEEKREEINSMSVADIDAFTRQYGIAFEINNGAITGACLEEQYAQPTEDRITILARTIFKDIYGKLATYEDIVDKMAHFIYEQIEMDKPQNELKEIFISFGFTEKQVNEIIDEIELVKAKENGDFNYDFLSEEECEDELEKAEYDYE